MAASGLNREDAERLRSFERRVHDAVSAGYYEFFTPVTLLASQPLLDLLKAHSVGHKWFSFLQGLGLSDVNPAQIPVAAREAKQPV